PRAASKPGLSPAVRITTVKVRGIERTVSAAGAAMLADMQLHPDENQVEFGFTAPDFRSSNDLLYQYRLEGARFEDWSTTSKARSVNFASLPPGSYRFLV